MGIYPLLILTPTLSPWERELMENVVHDRSMHISND
jgi:hypothetical protein